MMMPITSVEKLSSVVRTPSNVENSPLAISSSP